MRIASKLVYMLAATTLLTPPLDAQLTAAPALTADSIIARYYRAIGGYDKIKSVVSRKMVGSYSEGALQASTEILWRRPMLRRVNISGKGFGYSEGFDGATWVFDPAAKKLMRDKDPKSVAAQRSAEFDESIVDYRTRGYTVTLIGTTRVADSMAYRLRVRLTDGWEKDYLIGVKSFLIVAVRQAAAGPAVATESGSYSMYEDWRVVGGVRVPFRFVEKSAATGKVLNTLQWKSISQNVSIPDAAIHAPAQR